MEVDSFLQEIRNAQKGSNIYQLVEKMAYKLHEEDRNSTADDNWFLAQENLRIYSDNNRKHWGHMFTAPLEKTLQEIINFYAFTKSQLRGENYGPRSLFEVDRRPMHKTSFDDWIEALDDVAKSVIYSATEYRYLTLK